MKSIHTNILEIFLLKSKVPWQETGLMMEDDCKKSCYWKSFMSLLKNYYILEELEELDNELEELELLLEELLLEEQGFTGFKLWNKRISLATSHLWNNRITCKVLNKMREQKTICLLELTTGILENEYLMFYFLSVKKWGIVICLGYTLFALLQQTNVKSLSQWG